MRLGLGLGLGSGNRLPRYVTDYFNGFELSGSTYTGGPTVVADNTGALVTSPAGVLPIEGMRLSGSTWLPTTSLGAPIHPSTPLRTRKGTVSVYGEAYKGPLIEPARTNKVTCRKANPTDTAGFTSAGAVTVVDDALNLATAYDENGNPVDLTEICRGNVYKLAAGYYTVIAGAVGNVNNHISSVYARGGSCTVGWQSDDKTAYPASTSYKRITHNAVPSSAARRWILVAEEADVYFILPQLEEGAFATSPICRASDGSDPLTTVTRPAANLTRPTAGTALAALNNWGVRLRFRPTAAGQTAVLWGSYTDANNSTRIDLAASTLTYTKRLAGSNHVAQASLAHAAATLYDVIIYQHSASGMGIAFCSWNGSAWSAWSAWATLTDANGIVNAAIASTYQIGALNNASHVSANMPFCHVFALNPALNPQTQIADLLTKGRI